MMQLDAIRHLIQSDLDATDTVIKKNLQSDISLIEHLAAHIIQGGGKRLRPMLVLLGAKAFGYENQHHIALAAIIELIHTATLLHDDVIDASDLRRGEPTANAIWDNSASVLVGDFLYSRAFQMMVAVENPEVIAVLARATNTIVQGEVLQLTKRHNPETTEADYMDVIRYKTGALFEVAAQLGGVLCHCSSEQLADMGKYGMHLGTAFQLIDDALDYQSNSETIGKNIGDDLAEGKPTLPIIYALANSAPEQAQFIRETILEGNRESLDKMVHAIESTGAIEYTYQLARQEALQAAQYLTLIPESPYRDALLALTHFAVERNH